MNFTHMIWTQFSTNFLCDNFPIGSKMRRPRLNAVGKMDRDVVLSVRCARKTRSAFA